MPILLVSTFSCNAKSATRELKVMSFNILHGINYPHRKETGETIVNLDPVINIVKKHNPDIVNFNEIYGRHTDAKIGNQVKYIADKLGYYSFFVHAADIGSDKNYYGGAIMSRFPITYVRTHPIPRPEGAGPDFETRAIGEATIDVGFNEPLHVFESHFGLSAPEYELTVETLTPLVKDHKFTIFMGDLNLTPDSPFIKKIEEMMDEALDTSTLTFDSIHPYEHIDYIFKSHDLDCIDNKVLSDEIYSDHLPVMATIKY